MSPALPKNNNLDKNWHYVYLPTGKKTNWIYIGCTNDLVKRLKEHEEGKVFTTKKMLPVELAYYEAFKLKDYAYKREKNLKAYGSGLTKLKSRIGIDKSSPCTQ